VGFTSSASPEIIAGPLATPASTGFRHLCADSRSR
jgi:hypothetical protein